MPMTILVTRNVPDRFKGFLSSCMLELTPGVFVSPKMSKGVRDRVWDVMLDWNQYIGVDGGVIMFWPDRNAPSNLGMRLLGWPKKELIEYDGVWMVLGAITQEYSMDELDELISPQELSGEDNDSCTSHLID